MVCGVGYHCVNAGLVSHVIVLRALCFAGSKPSPHLVHGHLYTPLPVTYLDGRGVTSLGDDDVSDGQVRGAMRVTYTAAGCCVSPVRPGVELGHDDSAIIKMRRLLCPRRREKVLNSHCTT